MSISVFTGPMKCGKSRKLLHESNRQKLLGKKVLLFKPYIDNRFIQDCIVDRDNNKSDAINISDISELNNYDCDVYCIDEFQFLTGDIKVLQNLEDAGKLLIISGLNLTADKKPFGSMPELLCIADNIEVMSSICEECHNNYAKYSFCKINKTEDILVGDDIYLPVCNDCYNKLIKEV